ncbi:hypothetical protein ACVW1C_007681 [Bradyrhizobium sp. USDA 4011]
MKHAGLDFDFSIFVIAQCQGSRSRRGIQFQENGLNAKGGGLCNVHACQARDKRGQQSRILVHRDARSIWNVRRKAFGRYAKQQNSEPRPRSLLQYVMVMTTVSV